MIDVVSREDLLAGRDRRDVAPPLHKGCIIAAIRRKPTIYYWRKGRSCSARISGSAGDAARDFLATIDTATCSRPTRS